MNLTDISRLQASVDDVLGAGNESAPWFIAKVVPGKEGKVLAGLRERRIEAYLPCETRWTKHARKMERSAFAVFPGYIFIALPRMEFYLAKEVPDLVSFVGAGSPIRLHNSGMIWLRGIRKDEIDGEFDKTKEAYHAYEKGEKVTITEPGPLKGQVGTVMDMTADKRVRVMLNAAIGWDYCAPNDGVEIVEAKAA